MDIEHTFATLDADGVDAFVVEGQEEHLLLDFKLVMRDDLSKDDDRRNLARALSGFANSSGGLVVWGVDARKNADGVDCAIGTQPIPNVARFVGRLNELTGAYVSPVVDGVRHRAIPRAGDGTDGEGYAVTLIPASDGGPHMAKGPEYRYFKRSGDSFYRMEHFDLEDMFGRRKRPQLTVEARIVGWGTMGGGVRGTEHMGRIVLSIRNSGRGIARAPYLALEMSGPYGIDRYGVDGNGREGLPRLVHAGPSAVAKYGADASAVIHTGVALDITAVDVRVVVSPEGKVHAPAPLIVAYTVAAEDVPARSGSLEVSGEEVVAALLPPVPR